MTENNSSFRQSFHFHPCT